MVGNTVKARMGEGTLESASRLDPYAVGKKGGGSGDVDGLSSGDVRKRFEEGVDGSVNRTYLDPVVFEGRTIHAPNKYVVAGIKKHYGDKLSGFRIGVGDGSESVQGSLELESRAVDYSEEKKERFRRCVPLSWIGHESNCYTEDPGVIIHGGNERVYSTLEKLAGSIKNGKEGGSLTVIHGKNGLGKTFALNYFAYLLREARIPTVAIGVNGIVHYLNPKRKEESNPVKRVADRLDLAGIADVVLLDQMHNAVGKDGKWQLNGTQSCLFGILNAAEWRKAHVVFFATETDVFGFDDFKTYLGQTTQSGEYEATGHTDLADRFNTSFPLEIKGVPEDEIDEFVCKMITKNPILVASGVPREEIAAGIVAARYGKPLSPRGISADIRNIERLARYEGNFDVCSIIETIGGKRAKERFENNRVGFFGRDLPVKRDLAGIRLRALFRNSGYTQDEIRGSFEAYEDAELGSELGGFGPEIGKMADALSAYGEGDKGMGEYEVSDVSKAALEKLVSNWKDPQKSLF